MKIWHYTNFVALNGILIDGELRLCNTKGMNDKKEMLAFILGIEDVLISKYPDKKSAIRQLFHSEITERQRESVYGSSFSFLRDDAAQWERYGYGGKGVSIGFNLKLFEQIIDPYILEKVSYQKSFRNYDFVDMIGQLLISQERPEKNRSQADEIFQNLWACSGAYKDASFKSEKEIRLMTYPISPDSPLVTRNSNDGSPGDYGPIEYEITPTKIREYIIFHLKLRCQEVGIPFESLITDVIIGPKASQSMVILQNYLAKHGLKKLAGKVVISKCPLR